MNVTPKKPIPFVAPTPPEDDLFPIRPIYDNIPQLLRDHARWMEWTPDGEGKKAPHRLGKPKQNTDPNKATNWGTYEHLVSTNPPGAGFALGAVDKGPTISGTDCDNCRDTNTGVIEQWALHVIKYLNSYTEISPSGKGVKIFTIGALREEDTRQDKVYKLEIYDRRRYFAVTGHHLPGTPTTVEHRETELRQLYIQQQSNDLVTLTILFGFHKQTRDEWVDIVCPWAADHSGTDGQKDASLHLNSLKEVDGFKCFHASHADKTLADVLKFFKVKIKRNAGFITNARDCILANHQENLKRAWERLGITFAHDLFADKMFKTEGTESVPIDDAVVDRILFTIEAKFDFKPEYANFRRFIFDTARQNSFHPVRDYLDSLKWDGKPRIDTWLQVYGGAKDTLLNRAYSGLTLMAAVKRIREPGCKKDELLTLNNPKQGTQKSEALRRLCPKPEWFSDDLPLNVDSQEIVERTGGKWIIEISDLQGFRKSQLESLKAMFSRQVDGPVRLAYAHIAVERPRQFLPIGTTNHVRYLKDQTGNRRFWTVDVKEFDIAGIERDRDQLWAEATYRVAQGESIRLAQRLYGAAGTEQASRLIDDPWVEPLHEYLELDSQFPKDRVHVETIWQVALQINADRRTPVMNERLHEVMQSLGYEKKTMRGLEDGDKENKKRWCRIVRDEG